MDHGTLEFPAEISLADPAAQRTPDMGGKAKTADVGAEISARI
jgi:isocitrate/isopropylmalate dehydrogenase